MNRILLRMIRHRKFVILLCLVLLIPAVLGLIHTKTGYDLFSYLPEETEAIRGEEILKEEFGHGALSLVVTQGLTAREQAALEEQMKTIEHVDTVLGYESLVGTSIPSLFLPDTLRERMERGDARLSAVFFDEAASTEETMHAVEDLRAQAGESTYISGLAAVTSDLMTLVASQEGICILLAVLAVLAVLLVTTDAFLLPFVLLGAMALSIVFNMGTNFFLGEISFLTRAVASFLQLGLTLDYGIFLWHAYRENIIRIEDRDLAMAEAIHETFSSILGPGLTTMACFTALCFMSFALGRDLGLVMIKGIVFSILGTVTWLPCAIRLLDGAIEKTGHRAFLPSAAGMARFVLRHTRALAICLVLVLVPALYGSSRLSPGFEQAGTVPDTAPSGIARQKLQETFGISTSHLLLVDSALSQKETIRMTEHLEAVDGVQSVLGADAILGIGVPVSFLPEHLLSGLNGEQHRLLLVQSALRPASEEMQRQMDALLQITEAYDAHGILVGEAASTRELMNLSSRDFRRTALIALLAVFVILLLAERSVLLPIVQLLIIGGAVACNLSLSLLMPPDLPFYAPVFACAIQLGFAADLTILLTNRYVTMRKEGRMRREAAYEALSASAPSILLGGLGLFAATFGTAVYSSVSGIASLCALLARGAIISMIFVLFLLPPLLIVADPLIVPTTLGMRNGHRA
ncbi:MAG: MMPL family transporter [Clostridia bacterium]|nr:MMPL family transporter [Clostridia bacterium]